MSAADVRRSGRGTWGQTRAPYILFACIILESPEPVFDLIEFMWDFFELQD